MKDVDMDAPFINLGALMGYEPTLDMMVLRDDSGNIIVTRPVAEKSKMYDADEKKAYKRVDGKWKEMPIERITMHIWNGEAAPAEDEEDL